MRQLQDALREFVDTRAAHKASNAVQPITANLQRLEKEFERLASNLNGAEGIITRLAIGDRRMAEIEADAHNVSKQCERMIAGLNEIKMSIPSKDGFWDKKTVQLIVVIIAALLGGGLGGVGSGSVAVDAPGAAELAREIAKQLEEHP